MRADDGERGSAQPGRLRDQLGANPAQRRALDALRAVDPLTFTGEQRRRRLAALEARGRAATRRQPLLFRPAVALALLLAGAGGVGATVGRAALVGAYARATAALRPAPSPARPAPRPRSEPSVEAPSLAPAEEPIDLAEAPAAAPASRPVPPASPARSARSKPTSPELPAVRRVPEAPTPKPADESPLVYDAMVALRQRGDRATAATLAFAYLQRHPQGPLAEEAIEIAREALSRSDPSRARELAREYLRRFPRGVYRGAAERTIAGEGR